MYRWRQIFELWNCKPRKSWSYQKLEEERKDSPLESLKGLWPYRHLILVFCLQNCKIISFCYFKLSRLQEFITTTLKTNTKAHPKIKHMRILGRLLFLEVWGYRAWFLPRATSRCGRETTFKASYTFTKGRERMNGSLWRVDTSEGILDTHMMKRLFPKGLLSGIKQHQVCTARTRAEEVYQLSTVCNKFSQNLVP